MQLFYRAEQVFGKRGLVIGKWILPVCPGMIRYHELEERIFYGAF